MKRLALVAFLSLIVYVMLPSKVSGYSNSFIRHLCSNADSMGQRCDCAINEMTKKWGTEKQLLKQNGSWSRGETDDVNFVLREFEETCPRSQQP